MLHNFELDSRPERHVKLWQRTGESYEHILMKALGFAMFIGEFPDLQIEKRVGLRYKPDLVAQNARGEFTFWGECEANSIRKTAWLLKHAPVRKLVLFKIGRNIGQLALQLRAENSSALSYRRPLKFDKLCRQHCRADQPQKVGLILPDWYTETKI